MDDYAQELAEERSMKDQFMARHPESPFVAESVGGFEGLHYFEIDPAYRIPARLDRLPVPEEAYLRTNRDGQATMRRIGELKFRVGNRDCALTVYHAGEGVGLSVFVPFRDGTSGTESYGPGRYLTLELNEADEYELDFNRAFNPYCAYTDAYECGFPPAQNDLPVRIPAGEKVWSQDRNPATPNTAVLDLVRRSGVGRRPPASAKLPSRKSALSRRASRRSPPKRSPRPSRPARKPARKVAPRRSPSRKSRGPTRKGSSRRSR